MNDIEAELNGIIDATHDDRMPRVVSTFEHAGHIVAIIEPVHGSDDGMRRGYLWHAILGDFILEETRPGFVDGTRWVPGGARLLPGAELIAMSTASGKACAANARAVLRKRVAA